MLDAKDSFSKQRLFQAAWQQLYPELIEWISLSNGGKVTSVDGINENYRLQTEWTWTNTLNYLRTFGQHSLTVLLGHEANEFTERFEAGNCANQPNLFLLRLVMMLFR